MQSIKKGRFMKSLFIGALFLFLIGCSGDGDKEVSGECQAVEIIHSSVREFIACIMNEESQGSSLEDKKQCAENVAQLGEKISYLEKEGKISKAESNSMGWRIIRDVTALKSAMKQEDGRCPTSEGAKLKSHSPECLKSVWSVAHRDFKNQYNCN